MMFCIGCDCVDASSLNCPSCKEHIEKYNIKICRCSGKSIPENKSKELITASEYLYSQMRKRFGD